MTWLEIRPRDVWLFRDGKPFNAGEDNSATSMFPPTPMTVQGALRQKISEANGLSYGEYRSGKSKLAEDVGGFIGTFKAQKDSLDTGGFEMRGPFLGLNIEDIITPLLPCPADLLLGEISVDEDDEQEKKKQKDFFITHPQAEKIISDLEDIIPQKDTIQFLEVREGYENLPTYWITGAAFADYLKGKAPDKDIFLDKDYLRKLAEDEMRDEQEPAIKSAKAAIENKKHIFHQSLIYGSENRFGVSTDSATSFREEGQLYQAQFIRPTEDVGLLADIRGKHQEKHLEGIMTMGGEQRQALNELVAVQCFPELPDKVSGRFKIIFLTPAYFSEGWIPHDNDWSALFGAEVSLVSAALYRPQRIGGWNSAKGEQRAMYNYVAPGSVYYFETDVEIEAKQAITENPKKIIDAAKIGFGQVAYGKW
jgi:CRISPR-associated protein Cmr3